MASPKFQIIRGGRVLNIRDHRADPADILIAGDDIREIGPPGLPAPPEARAIDAAGKLLMPGLVNAHTHGHGSLGKGKGDRWSLELLLNAGPWISGRLTLEDKYLGALLNAAEMLRTGCTAAYDLYFEFPVATVEGIDAVTRGYAEAGIRAVIAPMMADRTLYEAIPGLIDHLPVDLRRAVEGLRLAPWEQSMAAARAVLTNWRYDRALLRPALAPTIPLHCSDEFITACRDLAKEFEVGLHMHLAESKVQAVSGLQRYARTLTRHLQALDFFGPNFTAAHGVWLDDEDMRLMADHGCSVAHNPGSNLRLGSGIAPVRTMLERGLNVGIGTDGSTSADNQNMFAAMRFTSFVPRILTPDYRRWLESDEVIDLATSGGARTLGFERIGRLAPGYKADIVFLDLDNLNFVPLNDPVNQIVNSEDGSAVDSVMVGGRLLLEHGRFTSIDHAKLVREAAAACERLRGATAELKALSAKLEDLVGQYCVGLARQPYHIQRTVTE